MGEIVVVGAGPAGIRATQTLLEAGLKPVLLDEGRRPGGQGYRWIATERGLDTDAVMGSEAAKYRRLHSDFTRLTSLVDYRPDTLVWGREDNRLQILQDGAASALGYDAVVLATGAMDRVMPMPGWTLPGVFTLGGAQVALKSQGCLIGRRVVFCGSSPLLPLAALQYLDHGAEVVAVCDTTPLSRKVGAVPLMLASAKTLVRGLGYLRKLQARGVKLMFGVEPLGVNGSEHVEGLRIRHRGSEQRLTCDALAIGYGLKPEAQLAELLGASMAFDPAFRLWFPRTDEDGRASKALYLAGDGVVIGGADAAEASGRLAALALLADLGRPVDRAEIAKLRREIARQRRFQQGLARAFTWPAGAAAELPGSVAICRCENVTAGEIRAAMDADLGPVDLNRVKAITRCGMGRCQGRVCGPALGEIVAAHTGRPLAEVGRLRGQAPVKPVSLRAAPAGVAS